MTRNVTLSSFQQMQRGESDALGDAQIPDHDKTAIDPLSGRVVDADPFTIDPEAEDAAATARLKAMGCGEPTFLDPEERGADDLPPTIAAFEVPAHAGDPSGLAAKLVGGHQYNVDNDGSVRDWREVVRDRADTIDADAQSTVHTITDEDAAEYQQASMFLVPKDSEFNGRLYRDAPELANIAERLIGSKEYLGHLLHCTIRYAWKSRSGTTKRRRQTGGLKRGTDWFGQLLGADFGVWLAADTARERHFTERHVERYLLHQLLKIGQDDKGNFVEQAPTLQVFAPEITEYADVADENDRIGRSAYRAAEQMGLFDEGIEDDEDEELVAEAADEDLEDLPTDEEIETRFTDADVEEMAAEAGIGVAARSCTDCGAELFDGRYLKCVSCLEKIGVKFGFVPIVEVFVDQASGQVDGSGSSTTDEASNREVRSPDGWAIDDLPTDEQIDASQEKV